MSEDLQTLANNATLAHADHPGFLFCTAEGASLHFNFSDEDDAENFLSFLQLSGGGFPLTRDGIVVIQDRSKKV